MVRVDGCFVGSSGPVWPWVACWRIMGKDGPETRSIVRFEPVLGIVGGASGGSFVVHFPMIGRYVVFGRWYRATVAY